MRISVPTHVGVNLPDGPLALPAHRSVPTHVGVNRTAATRSRGSLPASPRTWG